MADTISALSKYIVHLGSEEISAKTVLGKLGVKFTSGLDPGGFLTLFHRDFGVNVPDFKSVSLAAESFLERFSLERIIHQELRPRGRLGKNIEVWMLTELGNKVVLALSSS